MDLAGVSIRLLAASLLTIIAGGVAWTQPAPAGPPAVGVVEATRRPITETSEFLGRIEAINRVNVVARVTAFLEKRLFNEGAEVKKGDRALSPRARSLRGRSRVETGAGGPAPGDAGKRQADDRARAYPARRTGRATIDLRRGPREPTQPGGAGAGRAGASPGVPDQPRLHRDQRAD